MIHVSDKDTFLLILRTKQCWASSLWDRRIYISSNLRAKMMIQNKSSWSQNDHQQAKNEDGPQANPYNELLRLSAVWKVNGQLSLPGINSGGYYPFPSLARISAAVICPTLVIIDITLNHQGLYSLFPCIDPVEKMLFLTTVHHRTVCQWVVEPKRGEVYWDALTTKYSW